MLFFLPLLCAWVETSLKSYHSKWNIDYIDATLFTLPNQLPGDLTIDSLSMP